MLSRPVGLVRLTKFAGSHFHTGATQVCLPVAITLLSEVRSRTLFQEAASMLSRTSSRRFPKLWSSSSRRWIRL
ncbi:hypothetical protein OH76DRAFT_1405998 [Lentinus brumalis]|uniref:Uncharacterized protein n=1 Tax=Lentinus brumalis TaxID=2498619 RepID=A0A371D4F7_9APHY|nr:hypothetical protein OH76DRAFT_1405998 [Polyporus brumalis]